MLSQPGLHSDVYRYKYIKSYDMKSIPKNYTRYLDLLLSLKSILTVHLDIWFSLKSILTVHIDLSFSLKRIMYISIVCLV